MCSNLMFKIFVGLIFVALDLYMKIFNTNFLWQLLHMYITTVYYTYRYLTHRLSCTISTSTSSALTPIPTYIKQIHINTIVHVVSIVMSLACNIKNSINLARQFLFLRLSPFKYCLRMLQHSWQISLQLLEENLNLGFDWLIIGTLVNTIMHTLIDL